MTISPARPDELDTVFALLYGPDADDQITHARQLVAHGELDPAHVLVARTDRGVIGAVFCQPLPGAIAVIWPARAGGDLAIEDALTVAALKLVADEKVVQAFLPPEEAGRAGQLLRAGFRRVTHVCQMTVLTAATAPRAASVSRSAVASRLTIVPYPACDPGEFERALLCAHNDSLDCPELHGVRTADEVLCGYRDCAPDQSRWWLARAGNEPVGALVLGPGELAFVGVVPERRGQGIGRALVEHALAHSPTLSLIVDARNGPAIRLYQSLGFEIVGSRDVFLLTR